VKLLLDADVLLDTALRRQPFAADSDRLVQWCQETPQSAMVAWHSVSNLYYLLRIAVADAKAREFISDLMRFTTVTSGGTGAVRQALLIPMRDFEDALQVSAALAGGAEVIVTRNVRDFARSPLPAVTPAHFLRKIRPDE
jgi:predicted nucleic acid-binding protein